MFDEDSTRSVLGRGLTLINAVAERPWPVSLAELAAATSLPKPTVLRISRQLVARELLDRSSAGYVLGAEWRRLGAHQALRERFDHLRPLLDELHRAFAGITWVSASYGGRALQPVHLVCDAERRNDVIRRWPVLQQRSMLANTAEGRLLLARRPDLLDEVCRDGLQPATPRSPSEPRQLGALVYQVRATGVAVESGHIIAGWSCVAAPAAAAGAGEPFTVIGLAVPGPDSPSSKLVRAMAKSVAQLADTFQPASSTPLPQTVTRH